MVRLRHSGRFCARSSFISFFFLSLLIFNFFSLSLLILSYHLFFGLPLPILLSTLIYFVLFPTWSSFYMPDCPYHCYLLSCTFFGISVLFTVLLITVFVILILSSTFIISFSLFHVAYWFLFSCIFLFACSVCLDPFSSSKLCTGKTSETSSQLIAVVKVLTRCR